MSISLITILNSLNDQAYICLIHFLKRTDIEKENIFETTLSNLHSDSFKGKIYWEEKNLDGIGNMYWKGWGERKFIWKIMTNGWNMLELILGTVGKFELLTNNLWDIWKKKNSFKWKCWTRLKTCVLPNRPPN